jgi:hypothetical protein
LTRPRTGWQYGRRASEVGLIVVDQADRDR